MDRTASIPWLVFVMIKMRMTVKQTADNSADLMKGLRLLDKNQVLVGVPAANASRQAEKGSEISNAAIGYISQFGSPPQNIPARPWLDVGVKDVQNGITQQFQKAGEAALDGKSDVALKRFHAAGIIAVSGVKARINSNIPPPLAASTLASRRRRGHSGTRTLIETAQFRNSVTHILREK